MFFLGGFKSTREVSAFIASTIEIQRIQLAEHVHENLCQEGSYWEVKWSKLDQKLITWIHSSFRLFNMFKVNAKAPETYLMRQQIICTLLAKTRSDEHTNLRRLKDQLALLPADFREELTLRPGSSWRYGPADGRCKDSTRQAPGPATVSNPRMRMDFAQGKEFMENVQPPRLATPAARVNPFLARQEGFGLVGTSLVKVNSKNPAHREAPVHWALQDLGSASEYTKTAANDKDAFRCLHFKDLNRQDNAIVNSMRSMALFSSKTATTNDESDTLFRRMYEHTTKLEKGMVVMLLDTFGFYHRAVAANLTSRFPLSAFSHSPICAHLFVDGISDTNEVAFRILLSRPWKQLSPQETQLYKDEQSIWPPEDTPRKLLLPPNCAYGAFIIKDKQTFMFSNHPMFDQSEPPPRPAETIAPPPAVTLVLPPRPTDSREVQAATQVLMEHQSKVASGANKKNQPPQGRMVQHNAAPDSKRQRIEAEVAHRQSEPAAVAPACLEAAAPVDKDCVLSLPPRNNYNKLAVLQITLPGPPNKGGRCVCLRNWVHLNQKSLNHAPQDQSWLEDCTKPGCRRLHGDELRMGMVSYESIRYQIVHFHFNRPDHVRSLLDLVEQKNHLFAPEEE
eukprot:gene22118-28221_t